MPKLVLRDEKQAAWEVWPNPDAIPPGAVHENGRYVFEYEGSAGEGATASLALDDQQLEALRSTRDNVARWRWEAGFNAGSIEAALVPRPGVHPIRFEIVTDAELRKLTRDQFAAMLREILEDTFALFSLSGFRVGIAHSTTSRPPPVARLEFLRSRIEELGQVIRAIAIAPKRRLIVAESTVPYQRAGAVSPSDVLRSFRTGAILRAPVPNQLPPALQGFIPARIKKQIKRNSQDTPEHRQILGALRDWQSWLGLVAQQLDAVRGDTDQTTTAKTWSRRCRQLSRQIQALCELPLFNGVTASREPVRLSTLFRAHPQYRRFFEIWRDINLGLASVFGNFLQMPLARTWELYELWCFLRVVRAGLHLFGEPKSETTHLFTRDADGGLTLSTGAVCVAFKSDWALYFQRTYSEFWTEADGTGSYSRSMIPDIAVTRREASGAQTLVLLDAKYRVADALNDAIGSIHMYRDALVREATTGTTEGVVTAAYILTPDVPEAGGGDYKTHKMPGRLFRPDYQHEFRIGALTFKPGMDHAEIVNALELVIRDTGALPAHGHP